MIKITLPDGSVKEFEKGITPYQVALAISEGLARNVLAAKVNQEVVSLNFPIETHAHLMLLTWNDTEGKAVFWHSSAHLLAAAVDQLYPGVKFGIGPDIENGFYYDIDFMDYPISSDDFPKIEAKMMEIAQSRPKFERSEISKNDARALFVKKNNEYKVELIEDLEDGAITLYQSSDFIDLCRGPHLYDTAHIKALKLLNTAGAYWRGDEKRKQLTRIYGISFPKKKELDDYLLMLEEAKKRDHRKLGKELELFTFSQAVGAGLPIWLPKGAELRERLESFLKKVQKKYGYQQIICPHIGNVDLYKTSGYYQKYGADSFRAITTPQEGEAFFLKPMNCPRRG
jgi:threonyl-tRNA synthetase